MRLTETCIQNTEFFKAVDVMMCGACVARTHWWRGTFLYSHSNALFLSHHHTRADRYDHVILSTVPVKVVCVSTLPRLSVVMWRMFETHTRHCCSPVGCMGLLYLLNPSLRYTNARAHTHTHTCARRRTSIHSHSGRSRYSTEISLEITSAGQLDVHILLIIFKIEIRQRQ